MLPSEADRMMKFELQTPHEATWTPILWALKLLERARTEGKIKVHTYIQEVPAFRDFWFQGVIMKCGDHEFRV